MKRTYTVTHKEEVEVEVQFPMYLQPNEYTCVAILDEEKYLKCSVYEKYRMNEQEKLEHSVWINCAPDKYEVNKLLEEFFSGKSKQITPEEFEAFYFNTRQLVAKQFNKIYNNALPE
jgi:hypothetical protein